MMEPAAPLDGFTREEFKARRDALRAACPDGLILIRASTEDEAPGTAPFRQNSSFFYLTGLDTPAAYLALLPEGMPGIAFQRTLRAETREVLFLSARDAGRETWTGPQVGPGPETAEATGIEEVVESGGVWGAVIAAVQRNPVVYTVAPYGEQARTTREYALIRRIRELAPVAQVRDVGRHIACLRCVKSAAEVDRIREAAAITVAAQEAARAVIRSGADRFEHEVEAAVLQTFRSRGASPAFASIVGGGRNGTVLHYELNDAPMRAGDLVVVDIGARFGHYAADITRTYPVGGRLSPRQREIYDLVLAAHRHVVSEFRLGEETLRGLTDRCKAFLKDSAMRARDVDGAEQTMDVFMPHGVGHHLALDVHDVGDPLAPLERGAVITVEPGIYIPAEGIGVRLEDDYVVTDSGLERLGPPLAIGADEVEAAMGCAQ